MENSNEYTSKEIDGIVYQTSYQLAQGLLKEGINPITIRKYIVDQNVINGLEDAIRDLDNQFSN